MSLKPSSSRKSLTKAKLLSELDSASRHIAGLEAELARLRKNPPAESTAEPAAQPIDSDSAPPDASFRRLIEGSLQAIYVRQDGVTAFANQAYAELFGYDSPGDLIDKDHLELVAPQDRERMAKYREDRMRGGNPPSRYQYQAHRRDGSTIWIDGFRQLIEWKGRPAILGTLIDITSHGLAEKQLKEQALQLQQVFDAIPHTMTLIDNEGRYVLVNKAWHDFWGTAGDDPLSKIVNELVGRSAEDIASIEASDREALEESGGAARWFDQTLTPPGRKTRNLHTVKTPLRDSGGKITGLVGVGLDVTEHMRAAEQLRESEERLRAFMDSAVDVFNIFDQDLNLTEMSLSALKKWGGTREEKLGRHITELFPRVRETGRLERYKEVLKSGQPMEVDGYIDTPLMGRLYVRRKAFPVGRGLGTVTTDLTDLHRAQQETEDSAERFRAIAEATPYAMFINRKSDGQWRYANAMATEMFGVGDEISNVSAIDTYWEPSERQEFIDILEREGKIVGMESRRKRANGEMFWARVSSVPLRFEGEDAYLTSLIDITEQKTAQEELAANRRLLQTIFDSIPVGVYVKDRQRRYVMINRYHAEKNAVDPEALIGKTVEEIPQWTDAEKAAAKIEDEAVVERGQTIDIPERRTERPDGRIEWHRISRVPIYDDEGAVTGLVAIRSDITDLKLAAEELQANERLLQTIFDTLPVGVFVKDKEGRFLMVNRAFCEPLNLDPENFNGRFTEEVWDQDEEERARRSAQDRQVMETGERLEIPESPVTIGDSTHWYYVIKSPLHDHAGNVMGTVASRMDITERKHEAEELRRSQALLQTVFDTLPVGVFVKDDEGRFLMVNRAFCAHLELTPEEFISRPPEKMYVGTEEQRARTRTEDRYVMETGRRLEIPAKPDTLEDKNYWWHVIKSPLHDHAGNVVGVVGSRMNITERLRIEEQMRQMEKMEAVGKLAGGVAHEFNNILHMILGFTEIMLSQTRPGDSQHRNLNTIKKASEKGASMVRQLLGYSRKQLLQLRPVNVGDLLNSTAHIMMATLGDQVVFQSKPTAGLPRVYADPDSIEQILLNLCLNARDAMPEGGRLTIDSKGVFLDEAYCADRSWAKPGGYVRISVTDTGSGIPKDVLPRIFDPFFTTKGPQEGSGLGLSMVHGLMEQQNGCLHVESEPDRGTAFELYFPVVAEDAAIALELPENTARPAEEPPAPPATGSLILAVEDEAGVQQLTEQVLTAQGYRLLQAYDGEEGLRLFEQHAQEIDLLLLDVILPVMDGKELHERIAALRPEIPVVFHSGYHLDEEYTDYIAKKDLPLLRKPYTSAALMEAVQTALGKPEEN